VVTFFAEYCDREDGVYEMLLKHTRIDRCSRRLYGRGRSDGVIQAEIKIARSSYCEN
jgi:hypothetical protein